MTNKTLVVVLGATATGKTEVAIRLATALGGEIVSSDSRQVYREMRIGTAAPTPQEQASVRHHLIGTRSIEEEYSCGRYEQEATSLIERLFTQQSLLFLVGGSGLYIDAVCRGMDDMPATDPQLRAMLTRRLQTEGLETLAAELQQRDPTYYAQVDRQNPQRVMRALEVCLQTGRPYSEIRTGQAKTRPYRILKLGITLPREVLYDRINRRVDRMVEEGLEEEARGLYAHRHLNALQTVGYQEWFDYFDGKISREEAIELIKRNSRRYAKRQETWFRRDPAIHWITGGPSCADQALAWLREQLSPSSGEESGLANP